MTRIRRRMPREKDAEHLDFIRALPCVICGDNTTVEAAHMRMTDPRLGGLKRHTGMAEKPDDLWTLPLCGKHHREQHAGIEANFWGRNRIDPFFVAMALHIASERKDMEAAERIIQEAK